jgi:hypothetical protein
LPLRLFEPAGDRHRWLLDRAHFDTPFIMRTLASKISKIGPVYVTIETTETRDEWPEPFRASVDILHNGKPEETAAEYHRLISEDKQRR